MHAYSFLRLSPEGRHIAVALSGTTTDMWLYDLARDALYGFTSEGTTNGSTVWSPDCQTIAIARANPETGADISTLGLNGRTVFSLQTASA